MKIYRIAEDMVDVYRICIARQNPENPSITEFKSLYKPDYSKPTPWTPISIGSVLNGRWYVGTKAKFCLSYYSGNEDLEEGETEILVTLKVNASLVPPKENDAYMGSEAVVSNPLVVNIENVSDVINKEEYQ